MNYQMGAGNALGQPYQQNMVKPSAGVYLSRWSWDWPVGNGGVKGYPCIRYGRPLDWNASSTVKLPVLLNTIPSVAIDYNISESAPDAVFNTAFDVWICSDSTPTEANAVCELMVWVGHTNMSWTPNMSNMFIDGVEYEWYAQRSAGRWYMAFTRVDEQLAGSINLYGFLKLLQDSEYITRSHYLTDIDFGTELTSGSGEATLNAYAVTM